MGGKKRNKKKILEKEMKEPSTFSNFSAFPVPAKGQLNIPEVNQIVGPSYASVLGGNKWSALFKTESTLEAEDEEDRADSIHENSWNWNDSESAKNWESDSTSKMNTNKNDVPLKEEHEVADTWEESAVVDPAINETERNIKMDELPSSSPPPLDENPDHQVSSSNETSDVEEKHHQDTLLVPDRAEEINYVNLESLVVKLMEEVRMLKESQTNISFLEQQLDESKVEIQQLRNRIDALESGSQSVEVEFNRLQSKSHSQNSETPTTQRNSAFFLTSSKNISSWKRIKGKKRI